MQRPSRPGARGSGSWPTVPATLPRAVCSRRKEDPMSIQSEKDLRALARVGKVVGTTLEELKRVIRPGLTTAELNARAEALLHAQGARSAPRLFYRFPGATCVSVNDEAVHGIPGPRVLQPGDLVKIDVTAELDGYVADAAVT